MTVKSTMELIGEANAARSKDAPDVRKILDDCAVGYVPKGVREEEGQKATVQRAEAKAAVGGTLAGLRALLDEMESTSNMMSALERIVTLKRIAKEAEGLEAPFIRAANIEFAGMKAMEPNKKAFPVGGAEVKVYTKGAKYEYPPEVKTIEEQFKAAKKTAVANGTAIDVSEPFDPAKDRTFAVTV